MTPLVPLVLAVALPAPPAEPAPRLARYVLAESSKTVSPAGERASAVRGVVEVLGGMASWRLESGTFPRSRANAVLLGERGGWLVDGKGSIAARISADDLRALFVPPANGDPGPFRSAVREVEVAAGAPERGSAFGGHATTRRSFTATWSLVTSMPGREARIRTRLSAVFDLLDEPPAEVRSPLDDPGRLLDVPDTVREALDPLLSSFRGFPVGIVVRTEAEQSVDYPGMEAPAPDGRRPLRMTSETTRAVSGLETRPAAKGDAAGFELSDAIRAVGLERLSEPRELLR